MCGIAGVAGGRQGTAGRDVLKGMLAAIQHRGPDSAGLYQDGHAAIGSRRLSIIDLATGDQPIANEREDAWVVYNGEIYNYRPLRDDLRARGHRFRTETDTEVIVHAYEEYGANGIGKLDGMFAIALWDARRHSLVLARDRFGKKPLYYARVGDELIFASEIQAFLAHPRFVPLADPMAIASYLTYSVVTTEQAALAGVRRVPAASTIVWTNDEPKRQRYWRLDYHPVASLSFAEAVDGFRERFERAVTTRLVSDVPVGAFLSGGLDSSSVVAVVARASRQPVRTFSVGFGEQGYSELEFARAVAQQFETDHVEALVDPSVADVLPKLVGHFGEPFADASALPTYLISRVAGEHLKVALSGDGGDELLGGYRRHHIADAGERLHRSPVGLVGKAVDGLVRGATPQQRHLRVAQSLGRALPDRYVGWRSVFDRTDMNILRGPALPASTERDESDESLHSLLADERMTATERVMAADLEHYLVFDLMPKTDITAMACSLEVRSPFLDRELVEFLAHLPVEYRLENGRGKRILRAAMRGVLPDPILARGKHGFDVPIDHWLGGELRPLAEDCLLGDRAAARGFVRHDAAERFYRRHRRGDVRSGQRVWTLVMLELWARAFLDGDYRPTGTSAASQPREVLSGAAAAS